MEPLPGGEKCNRTGVGRRRTDAWDHLNIFAQLSKIRIRPQARNPTLVKLDPSTQKLALGTMQNHSGVNEFAALRPGHDSYNCIVVGNPAGRG